MKALGMAGSAMPRAKASDFDMALQLLTIFGNDKARKQGMTELRDAKGGADEAREASEAAERKAAERGKAAQEAEANATRARQALADETEKARVERSQRMSEIREKEKAQCARDLEQESREQDIARRERLLRDAGVVLPE